MKNINNEILIVSFEGIDTCGKSSQIDTLDVRLTLDGYKVKKIHFPDYTTKIGKLIQSSLFDGDTKLIQHLYIIDQMRFFLDDSDPKKQIKLSKEFDNVIENYDILLIDRYEMSTLAYSMAKKENYSEIYAHIKSLQSDLPKPNLTFLLDLPATEVRKRKSKLDMVESDFIFMCKVRHAYKEIPLLDDTDRTYIEIDACIPKDTIANIIYKDVKFRLNKLAKR